MMLDLGGEALFLYKGRIAAQGRAEKLLRDGAFLRSIGPELPLRLSPGADIGFRDDTLPPPF